jgi:hypothetical protein
MLIDWEAGAIEALRPLLTRNGVTLSDDEIIAVFQDLEEPLTQPPFKPYREVLAGVVDGFGRHFGFPVGAAERSGLAASVPSWRPFPDTVEASTNNGGRPTPPSIVPAETQFAGRQGLMVLPNGEAVRGRPQDYGLL